MNTEDANEDSSCDPQPLFEPSEKINAEPAHRGIIESSFILPGDSITASGISQNGDDKLQNAHLDQSEMSNNVPGTLQATQLIQSKQIDNTYLTDFVLDTKLFNSGLDDATLTGSLYSIIDQNSRRAITNLVLTSKEIVHAAIATTFQTLKNKIDARKLYVLFEKTLDCNPKYDHLNPKSTLPIFSTFIEQAEESISNLILPRLFHEIELTVARTFESDLLRKQSMHEELEDLRCLLDRSRNQLSEFEVGISKVAALNAVDRKALLQQILILKEQLHWRGKLAPDSSNIQYKPDYMNLKGGSRKSWYEELDDDEDEEGDEQSTNKRLQYLKSKRLLQELEDSLKVLEQKIEEKRQLIAQLNMKHDLLEAEVKRISASIDATDERHRQLRVLQKESEELDRLIAEMHSNYDAKMKDIEKLQKKYKKALEEAEQRTSTLANQLLAAQKVQKADISPAINPNRSNKENTEISKYKKQIEEMTQQLKCRDDEIERLKQELRQSKEDRLSNRTPHSSQLSPEPLIMSSISTGKQGADASRDVPKDSYVDPHLTLKLDTQAEELANLRKKLEEMTEKLKNKEEALQKEKATEKVMLGNSPITKMESSTRKSASKLPMTKSVSCGPSISMDKFADKSVLDDACNLTPEEEKLLSDLDPIMAINKELVRKARSVLQAAIQLNKHREDSLKNLTSASVETTKAKLDELRQTTLNLLKERELVGLIDTRREDAKDLTTIYDATKAAKNAIYKYKDASVGVYNGTDDDRRGSIGDDAEADGYDAQIHRASHAADVVLGTRRSTRKFQIHYDSRTTELERPDDIFNRLYSLAEITRNKLSEKRKEYMTQISEKEARKMRYKLQATDTMVSALNSTLELISKSMVDTKEFSMAKTTITDAFTKLVGAMLETVEHSSEYVPHVLEDLKEQVTNSLISLHQTTAPAVNSISVAPFLQTLDRTESILQPIVRIKTPSNNAQPRCVSVHDLSRSATDFAPTSITTPTKPIQDLIVQTIPTNKALAKVQMIDSETSYCQEDILGALPLELPLHAPDQYFAIPSQVPQINEFCTSSTLRSFPSRNVQHRASHISRRIHLFDSSGNVLGFISPAGDLTFYGEYAQYSTQKHTISDISDTTCSLLSSRGSSRNSSRVNSRIGSANRKDSNQPTYMLQQVIISDPANMPRSHHSILIQTDLSLLERRWPIIEYLNPRDGAAYRHKVIHNYRDMPLNSTLVDSSMHGHMPKTPCGTDTSIFPETTTLSAEWNAGNVLKYKDSVDEHDSKFGVASTPRSGIGRSTSCLNLSNMKHRRIDEWSPAIERTSLHNASESPVQLDYQQNPNSLGSKVQRARSESMCTRGGFRNFDPVTGRLDISERESAYIEERLARLASTSLINPHKIGSTIQKPTLLIYDTDTAPIRYRKTVNYMEAIGGDPKDINIMAIVTESGDMLRNPEAIQTLLSLQDQQPPESTNKDRNKIDIRETSLLDDAAQKEQNIGMSLSASDDSSNQSMCAISERSVNTEAGVESEPPPYASTLSKPRPLGASSSEDTTHNRLLSSFTDLLKKREDAFLVKSFDNSQACSDKKNGTSNALPLLSVKIASTINQSKPLKSDMSVRAGSVEPIKGKMVSTERSKSISAALAPSTPRMKLEDLVCAPLPESRCYLNNVTEKSLKRSTVTQGGLPPLTTLRDSRENVLIFNDRMVDDFGQIHCINIHKDGWDSTRDSLSTRVMKQQAVSKIKTPVINSNTLRINTAVSRVNEPTPLSSSTSNKSSLAVRHLPKLTASRGMSASPAPKISAALDVT